MVFLPGLGQNDDDWRPVITGLPPTLTGRYLPLNRGSGFSIEDSARGVRDQLDELDEERVDVVGLSLGAMVALRFAADHPKRVRRLVISGGQVRPPRAPREPARRTVHGRTSVDDFAWMADRDDPRLRAYLEAENAYAAHRTAALDPLVEVVVGEITSRTVETDLSVPVRHGGWWYYSRTVEGSEYPVHARVATADSPARPVLDGDAPPAHEQVLLDENVDSKDDVLELGIQTGDIIAMDPRTTVTESGYIKSRFLDDKLSASILLGLARAVADGEVTLSRKVSLLFTVYEEVGHGGAFVPADTREMISVDMGCVGDDLGCTERMVSICAKDSGGPYNYDLVTTLSNIARELELDYAIDVYPHYGSDVEATLSAGYDIRHGLIGPGVYASHNYERSHIDGVRNTFELVRAYVQR